MYSEAEAARLLRIAPSTLHYWLEGGRRRGRVYKPILRDMASGSRAVTWAEFMEAALLRQYRREHHVPMAELRAFIELLREETGVPYPLAHAKPFIAGRELVSQAQEEASLHPEFCLVATVRGQYMLTPASQSFFERVVWDDDIALGWRPHADPKSPVRVSPELRFGRPSIGGISTEILWEHAESGESVDESAAAFGIDVQDVHWALAYETSLRAA